jgi:CheY-like chemotaxis protein
MKKRILLIEDDPDARMLFKRILLNAGYEVDDLANGSIFFNSRSEKADLFILDNTMPTIDGIALTKYLRVKEDTRHIPVLLISANPTLSGKALTAGASAFLPKPFDATYFLSTVSKLISDQAVPLYVQPNPHYIARGVA